MCKERSAYRRPGGLVQRRGAVSRRVVTGWIGSENGWRGSDAHALARREVEIGACRGDRRTEKQVVSGCPRGLVEPHVTVAIRVAARRHLGGFVVSVERHDVPVRFMAVTMMHESVRQHRGRVSGPEGEAQSCSQKTLVAEAAHQCEAILTLCPPQPRS